MGEFSDAGGHQYLSFKLDQESFALNVASVREILDLTQVTRIPQSPTYMKGVINLRGSVVPVMDLRLRFGLPEGVRTEKSCIIVVEVTEGESPLILGVLADSVQEVMDLEPEDIEAAPRLGTRLNNEFIAGMGRHNGEFIIIVNIGKVFADSFQENVADDLMHELVSNA